MLSYSPVNPDLHGLLGNVGFQPITRDVTRVTATVREKRRETGRSHENNRLRRTRVTGTKEGERGRENSDRTTELPSLASTNPPARPVEVLDLSHGRGSSTERGNTREDRHECWRKRESDLASREGEAEERDAERESPPFALTPQNSLSLMPSAPPNHCPRSGHAMSASRSLRPARAAPRTPCRPRPA